MSLIFNILTRSVIKQKSERVGLKAGDAWLSLISNSDILLNATAILENKTIGAALKFSAAAAWSQVFYERAKMSIKPLRRRRGRSAHGSSIAFCVSKWKRPALNIWSEWHKKSPKKIGLGVFDPDITLL